MLCGNLDYQCFLSTVVCRLVLPTPWRNFCCCQERYRDLRTIYHYIGDAVAPPNFLTCASFTCQWRRPGACVVALLWMVQTESQPELGHSSSFTGFPIFLGKPSHFLCWIRPKTDSGRNPRLRIPGSTHGVVLNH
jgi:hypothetical protein